MFCLAFLLSIGLSAADYSSQAVGKVAGCDVLCQNYIKTDLKRCGAITSTSDSAISVAVSMGYYWYDPINDRMYSAGAGNGGHASVGISAPVLTGELRYYKVVSDHNATCSGQGYYCHDLTTIAP